MAAHAVDEFIEVIEIEEKREAIDSATDFENGDLDNRTTKSVYMPPPPLVTRNAYKQVRKVISFFQGDCCVAYR